ncbi:hypothetical protein [Crateriforma conspicua]|uniref:Uncharacterized protein n=1 Tax=Crateriforma conspicua TaxID=2527996 RepID=A0A5C6FCV3_9PLAN|nr:hypothetical protein [Crateriforma conspicua]TWU59533.1 hypothetical protein V7x_55790 [Crateriforma conspicua]
MVAAMLFVASCISPIIVCFFVVDSLVGIERLTTHYWLHDGIVISVVFNAFGAIGFLSRIVRDNLSSYSLALFLLVSVATFLGYGFFMISLLGV